MNDPTPAGLTATLTPLLADHAFAGDTVAMLVADAASGQVLFGHAGADCGAAGVDREARGGGRGVAGPRTERHG